jgi:tetratricopeptide (TPR) repeat protein
VYTRFSRLGFAGLPSVFSRAFLVRALAELGEFDDAMQPANDAVAIAEQVREDVDLLAAHSAYGALLLRRGDHDRSADMLERCLHLEVVSGHPYWFPLIAAPLGIVYVRTGRLPEGLPLLEQAVELAERSRIRGAHSERLAMLSEAYLAADRVDEASALANRAVATARRHGERGLEAAALRLLGKIAERRDPGDREGATTFYREARALAEELEMRPLAARIEDDLAAMARA